MAKLSPDYIEWVLRLNASEAQEEIQKLTSSNKALASANKDLKKQMTDLIAAGEKESDAYKNLNAELAANSKAMAENNAKIKKLESSLDTGAMSAAQLYKRMTALRRELRNTVKSLEPERYAQLKAELDKVTDAYREATGAAGQMNKSMLVLSKSKALVMGALAGFGAVISGQIVGAFRNAFDTVVQFEKRQSFLAGVLGTTKESVKGLTDEARRLGSVTSFTAAQVTELQIELAKLGFGEDQIMAMTAPILDFAKAVETDLGSAATLAGATLRIFGLEASETERVVLALTVGCNASALSFEYLQTAISVVGPVASTFGFTVEDTTALLGALSNAGFRAESAGTAVRNILLNLADSNGKLAQALGQPVTDLEGLVQGLQTLNAEGIDLAGTLELTDKESVAAFNSFLQQADSLLTLRDAVTDANDVFKATAEEMGNNVAGSVDILQSTIEGLILRFYESKGLLRDIIDLVTLLISGIGYAIDFVKEWKTVIYALASGFATYVASVKLATVWTATFGKTAGLMNGVMNVLSVSVAKVRKAVIALSVAIKSNPWAAALSAVVALGVALYNAAKSTDNLTEAERRRQALKERQQTIDQKVADEMAVEKQRLEDLRKVAMDDNTERERRLQAIEQLNRIVPDYNARLDEETGKYIENKAALDKYLASLEKKIRMEANQEELTRLIKEEERLKRLAAEAQKEYEKVKSKEDKKLDAVSIAPVGTAGMGGNVMRISILQESSDALSKANEAKAALKEASDALADFKQYLNDTGTDIVEVYDNITTTVTKTATTVQDANTKVAESVAAAPQVGKSEAVENKEKPEDALKKKYEKLQAFTDSFYAQYQLTIERNVAEGQITQQQADANALLMAKNKTADLLAVERQYYQELSALDVAESDKKAQLLAESYSRQIEQERQLLRDESAIADMVRQYSTPTYGKAGMDAKLNLDVQQATATYDAVIDLARQAGLSTEALERQKTDALLQINTEYADGLRQIQSQVNQSWAFEYESELAQLQQLHQQGLISEKEYQQARIQLQTKNAKKYFDYYSGAATGMIDALQQAEIDKVEAKYDVLIREAQNNGEDTAALEEEKENEKLKIQKKYADVNFAIKISQIIADTAVSIMTAFAQLGPIGGAVAAVMLAATGAAQVISAKAERDKVKNMQPGNTGSSSGRAERVVGGFAEGGYTGDGRRYEVAGVVHRGEYVVPMPEMSNPRVLDAVGTIEAIRRQRTSVNPLVTGFAEGGYTGQPTDAGETAAASGLFLAAAAEFRQATENLRMIRAFVTLQDIDDQRKILDSARRPFTRNNP